MAIFKAHHLLLISIFMALIWGGGSYALFQHQENRSQERSAVRRVVCAKKYIRAGQRIEAELLEEKNIPVAYIQPSAFEKISDFIDNSGRPAYTSGIGFLKNEQITRSKVVEETAPWDLSWALEPKKVGFTLSLDPESAAGGHLKPGDWVAVMSVFDPQPGIPEARADVIESRVQIAAVNGRIVGTPTTEQEKIHMQNISNDSVLVTLSLSARQASRVLLSRNRGHVVLALRSAVDEGPLSSGSVGLSGLRQYREDFQ